MSLEQARIGAGGQAVHAVVGAHHRVRAAFFDGRFEVRQVGFREVALVDHGVEGVALAIRGRCARRSVWRWPRSSDTSGRRPAGP